MTGEPAPTPPHPPPPCPGAAPWFSVFCHGLAWAESKGQSAPGRPAGWGWGVPAPGVPPAPAFGTRCHSVRPLLRGAGQWGAVRPQLPGISPSGGDAHPPAQGDYGARRAGLRAGQGAVRGTHVHQTPVPTSKGSERSCLGGQGARTLRPLCPGRGPSVPGSEQGAGRDSLEQTGLTVLKGSTGLRAGGLGGGRGREGAQGPASEACWALRP